VTGKITMTETLTENIDQFISFFRDRLDEIGKISNVLYAHQYQKLLYLSAVDALARVRWPKEPSNQRRFTEFVHGFAKWPDDRRVSLPHLDKLLKDSTALQFSALREFVRRKMKDWKPGRIYSLDVDPDIEDIIKLWPKSDDGKDVKLHGLGIKSLTHIKLLYACRNTLVHEFRSPSADFSSAGPSYVNQLSIPYVGGRKTEVWTLSYPVSFIKGIATNCLDNLETYLRQNKIDPYDSFVFGDYWQDLLNRD